MGSNLTKQLAGGTQEARCNTCKNVITFPDAQNFEEFKTFTKMAHAHQNRIRMTLLGFFIGAALGNAGVIIIMLAYLAGAGYYLYNRVKGEIKARKELFEEPQNKKDLNKVA